MSFGEQYIRVNGNQLNSHVGKKVLLLGRGIQAGSMSVKVEACDGQVVEVKLNHQPDGNTSCLLEVAGTATGARSITADELNLQPDWSENFDMETYNSALETIHSDRKLQEFVLGMH